MAADLRLVAHEFEYTFAHFSSLPHDVGSFIDSPDFEFRSLRWKLRLYPGGEIEKDANRTCVYVSLETAGAEAHGLFNVMAKGSDGKCVASTVDFYRNYFRRWCGEEPQHGLLLSQRAEVLRPERKFLDSVGGLCVVLHLHLAEHFALTPESCALIAPRDPSELAFKTDMLNLQQSGAFSDVVFKIGRQKIKAHRAVLSSRCPVFKAMFNSEMRESKEKEVPLEDLKAEPFQQMLRYMYTNECDTKNSDDDLMELLVVADRYSMQSLVELCSERLAQSLSAENVCDRLVLADRASAVSLKDACLYYIAADTQRIKQIQKSAGYSKLSREHLDALVAALAEPPAKRQRIS